MPRVGGLSRSGYAEPVVSDDDARTLAVSAQRLRTALRGVIEGKDEAIERTLVVLFAGGHLLIEDHPGVGKTMLARSLGRALDAPVNRIQFTADLLPSDLTGVSIFNPQTRAFEFSPGPLFAPIVIADEINRASPKAQSALLEAMEEGRVSVDGVTHVLPSPFLVIATQNSADSHGTFPLPEAQRDRFMLAMAIGYPSPAAEVAMLDHHVASEPLEAVTPVASLADIDAARRAVRAVHLSEPLKQGIVDVLTATRRDERAAVGASPRAGLHWARAAMALAALQGRGYVVPEDLTRLALPALAHRIVVARAHLSGGEAIVTDALGRVRWPR